MSVEDTKHAHHSDISDLVRELGRRTKEPYKSFPFWTYFIVGTLLFGGLGFWSELAKYLSANASHSSTSLDNLVTSLVTFFPALIGTAALQLVYISFDKGDKLLMSFAIFLLFVLLVSAIVLSIMGSSYPTTVLAIGVVCTTCSAWLWWITNADDPAFKNKLPDDAAVGGDTNRNLVGDLEGFSV